MKASKIRELVLKKQNELEEIYRGVHMEVDGDAARQRLIDVIDSGCSQLPCFLLFWKAFSLRILLKICTSSCSCLCMTCLFNGYII